MFFKNDGVTSGMGLHRFSLYDAFAFILLSELPRLIEVGVVHKSYIDTFKEECIILIKDR